MTRAEILKLATEATQGDGKAKTRFRTLALAAGFVGQRGGWIYSANYSAPICQGWQALAEKARHAGWVLDRLVGTKEATTTAP